MEGILRLQRPVFEENLPGKIICRAIVVILCMFALGILAQSSSMEYEDRIEKAKKTGNCVQTKGSVRKRAEISEKEFPCEVNKATARIGLPEITEIEMPEASGRSLTEEMTAGPEDTESIPDIYTAADAVVKEENKENLSTPEEGETAVIAVLKVYVHGNGGKPELSEISVGADMFTIESLPRPKRMGKLFAGWYMDEACTVPFSNTGTETMDVYAGWKEYPGFVTNDSGYITGCSGSADAIIEGLLRIPDYDGCTGIESGAFTGLEDSITEIFIPANITYIAPDAFESLNNLMYFEVIKGNPAYYSEYGILYHSDGTEAVYPPGRKNPGKE